MSTDFVSGSESSTNAAIAFEHTDDLDVIQDIFKWSNEIEQSLLVVDGECERLLSILRELGSNALLEHILESITMIQRIVKPCITLAQCCQLGYSK